MVSSPKISDETARQKAGNHGLWKASKKVNMLALSWKLLEDLRREKIGIWEIECQAWNRSMNRRVKLGKERIALEKGRYGKGLRRDTEYVCKLMDIRIQQAKEDWNLSRGELQTLRRKLLLEAKGTANENALRREFRRYRKPTKRNI